MTPWPWHCGQTITKRAARRAARIAALIARSRPARSLSDCVVMPSRRAVALTLPRSVCSAAMTSPRVCLAGAAMSDRPPIAFHGAVKHEVINLLAHSVKLICATQAIAPASIATAHRCKCGALKRSHALFPSHVTVRANESIRASEPFLGWHLCPLACESCAVIRDPFVLICDRFACVLGGEHGVTLLALGESERRRRAVLRALGDPFGCVGAAVSQPLIVPFAVVGHAAPCVGARSGIARRVLADASIGGTGHVAPACWGGGVRDGRQATSTADGPAAYRTAAGGG